MSGYTTANQMPNREQKLIGEPMGRRRINYRFGLPAISPVVDDCDVNGL